ncbi:MAG TPA: hypothetical protein VFD87_13915, partial [Phototrophicaceae bacterium]|nr:hypothetical protein [Phototrophicaceae bacterium]
MDEPPGSKVSTAISGLYGGLVRGLRSLTERTLEKEPRWRRHDQRLSTDRRSGESITRRGEDLIKQKGKEAGREHAGDKGASGRAAGKSRDRDFTGINPQR